MLETIYSCLCCILVFVMNIFLGTCLHVHFDLCFMARCFARCHVLLFSVKVADLSLILTWLVATQIFLIFTPTWGNDPIWLIFFKWVETTNQRHIFRNNPPQMVRTDWDLNIGETRVWRLDSGPNLQPCLSAKEQYRAFVHCKEQSCVTQMAGSPIVPVPTATRLETLLK